MRILQNLRHTGSAPTQDSPETASLRRLTNTVKKGEVQKNPISSKRLEVLSGEAPVAFDVIEPPASDLTPLPTVYGPPVIPEGDVVPVFKKRNLANENRREIRLLKEQLRDLSEPSEDEQLDRILDWLSSKNLDDGFNYAQTFYNTTFLESLDKSFAIRLAQNLYAMFASQGRVYAPWADFVSHTPVLA